MKRNLLIFLLINSHTTTQFFPKIPNELTKLITAPILDATSAELSHSFNETSKEIKILNKGEKFRNKIKFDLNSETTKLSVTQRRKLVHQNDVIHQDTASLGISGGIIRKICAYENHIFKRTKRQASNESINANLSVDNVTTHTENTNTSKENYFAELKEFLRPKAWTWLLICVYAIIFFSGLIGNALVVVAVYRNRTMRTVTNYFIVNLAIADFFVILFCLPPSLIWSVMLTWFFGMYMCKIVIYFQTVSVTVSVLTLAFISVDRWQAICFPLKFKSTTKRAKSSIVIIWILAFILDIPELIVYDIKQDPKLEYDTIYFTQCVATWEKDVDTLWTIIKMVVLYAVPLIFMSYTYISIILVLWKSGNEQDSTGNYILVSNKTTLAQLRSRKKAARMLVSVVIMFAVCYFPVHLQSILRLTIEMDNSDANIVFVMIAHGLCYANSAINPIIYNFMSGKFRKEFRRSIDCCSSASRLNAYEMANMRPEFNRDSRFDSTRTTSLNIPSKD